MQLQDNSTLLFIGDSITDCGRARPVGARAGLGEGYVAFVDAILAAACPERRIRVLNTGIGGNRVTNLRDRWQSDCLDLAPDWLGIMIGINDVWRQFDNALEPDQVTIDRYESILRGLLQAVRPTLDGLVLMTPYFIETNRRDPMREMMDAYGAVVERLASEFDAVFVNVQAAFDRYLAAQPTQSLCGDRVHPNKRGHMIIAASFLTGIGLDWATAGQPIAGS